MKYKAVIFDLDGTLIDTLEDLSHAMNAALNRMGLSSQPVDACRKMIGNGIRTFASRALGPDRQNLLDQVVTLMCEEYQQNLYTHSRIYNGVFETVKVLAKQSIRMGVITNKNHLEADRIVRHFFGSVFSVVSGVNDITPVKPDPSGTLRMIQDMQTIPSEALFVGDSEVDMETANNAGIRFIGAGWGFRGRGGLFAAGATDIIDQPSELLAFVA